MKLNRTRLKRILTEFWLLAFAIAFAVVSEAASAQSQCTAFPLGHVRMFSVPSGIFSITSEQISPDGQSLLWTVRDWNELKITAQRINLTTGQEEALGAHQNFDYVTFSEDGKYLAQGDRKDGNLYIKNLETGNTTLVSAPQFNAIHLSSGGVQGEGEEKIEISFKDGRHLIRDLKTGSERIVVAKSISESESISANGDILLETGSSPFQGKVLDLKTGEELSLPISAGLIPKLSKDGKKILFKDPQKGLAVFDLATKVTSSIPTSSPEGWIDPEFSGDGRFVVVGDRSPSAQGMIRVYDFETKTQKVFPTAEAVSWLTVSPDGETVLYGGLQGGASALNPKTGQISQVLNFGWVMNASVAPGNRWVIVRTGSQAIVIPNEPICIERKFHVENLENCADCGKPQVLPEQAVLGNLLERTLCQGSGNGKFDQEAWDREAPLPTTDQLPRDLAMRLLLRFQKPKGFEPTSHLPVLLAILESDLPKKEPALVLGALQTVLNTSNRLYEKLLELHPELLLLKVSPDQAPCRSPQDLSELTKGADQYLNYLITKNGRKGPLRLWENLGPLTPLLSRFSKERKEEAMDQIAQGLADAAADTPEFHGVFLSKLYKFTYQKIAPLFGEKPKSLTDLTLIREETRVTPILLGTETLDGNVKTQTPFGFYAKIKRPILVPSEAVMKKGGRVMLVDHEVMRWQMGEKSYQSQLSIQAGSNRRALVPEGAAPRYDQLWKNGTLTGLVITGSNLTGLASTVMGEYLSYYQSQGFQFEAVRELPQVLRFLQQKIESGELSYLIKEAHSDGDEKNLFRLDVQAQVQIGTKKFSDGRKERVYLVFPSTKSNQTALLGNQEFGSWLRSRQEKGHGQFVYFNTSCWSKTKAIHEIEAAETSAFLNIPSTTPVETFSNDAHSAEQILFTAFREGKNYEQMRKLLEADSGYKKGTANRFIFPGEPSYQDSITRILATPLKIDLKIQGPDGRPYQIDQIQE